MLLDTPCPVVGDRNDGSFQSISDLVDPSNCEKKVSFSFVDSNIGADNDFEVLRW